MGAKREILHCVQYDKRGKFQMYRNAACVMAVEILL
jgi:hypothetical protein